MIPPSEPLLASMPSGREYHTPKAFAGPTLDEDSIIRMRAPPDPSDAAFAGDEDDSADEEQREAATAPVGAFPGTQGGYAAGSNYY